MRSSQILLIQPPHGDMNGQKPGSPLQHEAQAIGKQPEGTHALALRACIVNLDRPERSDAVLRSGHSIRDNSRFGDRHHLGIRIQIGAGNGDRNLAD